MRTEKIHSLCKMTETELTEESRKVGGEKAEEERLQRIRRELNEVEATRLCGRDPHTAQVSLPAW